MDVHADTLQLLFEMDLHAILLQNATKIITYPINRNDIEIFLGSDASY